MRLATQTLQLIDEAMQLDQGNRYRALLAKNIPLAEDVYRQETDAFRSHLGASMIGRDCARALWYSFRWSVKPHFDGRMLRLFNRGHLEEARIVSLLELIGVKYWAADDNGKQFKMVGHKGHFGGSLDGVGQGISELPDTPFLGEMKTSSDKYFKQMVKNGVQNEKYEHYVQMQAYMGAYGLKHALYICVNKNDDDLHMEIVDFNPETYKRYLDRAAMIIDAAEPPPKINKSPGWYQCRFCDFKDLCHGEASPEINCRTCAASTPVENAKWICEAQDNREIQKTEQFTGCCGYRCHPTIKSAI